MLYSKKEGKFSRKRIYVNSSLHLLFPLKLFFIKHLSLKAKDFMRLSKMIEEIAANLKDQILALEEAQNKKNGPSSGSIWPD